MARTGRGFRYKWSLDTTLAISGAYRALEPEPTSVGSA
jgi:hypothetical protein